MQESFPCPVCGLQNAIGQQFCGTCGASLIIGCPYCGVGIPPASTFCTNCGAPLGWGTQHRMSGVQAPPREQQRSWLSEHPNWALIFGVVIVILFTLPLVFLPTEASDNAFALSYILLAAGACIYWAIAGWALRQKGQRLWHLAWILLGIIPAIGSLVTLAIWLGLENRRRRV